MPEEWTKIGKVAQKREKQEWAKGKPKLDKARKREEFIISKRVLRNDSQRKKKTELSQIHEERTPKKGCTSMTKINVVDKFIPVPQAMKRWAVDKMAEAPENSCVESG